MITLPLNFCFRSRHCGPKNHQVLSGAPCMTTIVYAWHALFDLHGNARGRQRLRGRRCELIQTLAGSVPMEPVDASQNKAIILVNCCSASRSGRFSKKWHFHQGCVMLVLVLAFLSVLNLSQEYTHIYIYIYIYIFSIHYCRFNS